MIYKTPKSHKESERIGWCTLGGRKLQQHQLRLQHSVVVIVVVLLYCVLKLSQFVISPPENDSFRKDFCFTHDVFLSSRNLWDAWADRREILHGGQY